MGSLMGNVEILLVAVQPLQIHGSPYYQLTYRTPGSEALQEMRINPEAFYPNPQPGDRVSVNMVMGNIMGASKLA